jgi:signal transduction histidine kinase
VLAPVHGANTPTGDDLLVNGPSPDLPVPRCTAFAADSELKVRGLLHDLGHQMMTLSLLAESVRDDGALSATARQRMEIVSQEMLRITELIGDAMSPDAAMTRAGLIDVREIATEAAQLASLVYDTAVVVEPGGPVVMPVSASVLRRVLRNLVDNAVRAAGPGGEVSIRIEQERETVLEIADSGPGLGEGPSGTAGLGLTVVRKLLRAAGGRLDIATGPDGGGQARVIFSPDPGYREQLPAQADRASARQFFGPPAEPRATASVR